MSEEVVNERDLKPLLKAIFKVQHGIAGVKRDGTNPFLKNKYITLDLIWDVLRPLLEANGLLVMQLPRMEDNVLHLETRIIHPESDTALWNVLSMTMKDGYTAQDLGSAVSYARRYSLAPMFGIVADVDDDGNAASGTTAAGKAPAKAAPVKPVAAIPAKPVPEGVRVKTYGKAGLPVEPVKPAVPESPKLTDPQFDAFNKYMAQLEAEPWLIKKYLEKEFGIMEMRGITIAALRVIKEKAEQGFFGKDQELEDVEAR